MAANKGLRPAGALTPYVSPAGAWALALGTSIGWGSLVVTSNTYLIQAGPLGSVLGMVAGMVIMLIIARNYHYMVECYPSAGVVYTYTKEIFGPDRGFLSSWFLFLTYAAMLWANATSLPLFARYFFGDMFRFGYMYTLFGYEVYLGEALLTIAAILVIALLCIHSKRITMTIMVVMAVVLSVGIILCFLGAAAGLGGTGFTMEPMLLPERSALNQVVLIACISPWAFIGFENISHASEEFTFSRTRTFRVLVAAVVTATVLYILVILLSVTAYPPEYSSWLDYIRDLGNLSGIKGLPPFYAAQYYLGDLGVDLLIVALLGLIVTSLIGNTVALSRLLYAVAKDEIIPTAFSDLNKKGIPGKAIALVAGISMLVPFLGRTAIGWIVDVTTIGAVIIYAFVSLCATKMARNREDRLERRFGLAGAALMIGFGVYLMLSNMLSSGGSMASESLILFTVWAVLGILFFRHILKADKGGMSRHSIAVWIALLGLVLMVSMIWMGKTTLVNSAGAMDDIRTYYNDESYDRVLSEEAFMEETMHNFQLSTMGNMVAVVVIFSVGLGILLANYSLMSQRAQKSEAELQDVKHKTNTDPLTGVKSKHFYVEREAEFNGRITQGDMEPFAVVVCDVNGLKYVNDTFGHKAGDQYIKDASALVCGIYSHSPVFRVGGDEFVVLLTGRDYQDRDNLLQALHDRSVVNIAQQKVVVAGGMSAYRPGEYPNFHAVFERADTLMYEEKQGLKSMGAVSSPHR